MSLKEVSARIAAKCYFDELRMSRALGHDGVQCYVNAFRCQDSVYAAAFEIERPYLWGAVKTIGNPGNS